MCSESCSNHNWEEWKKRRDRKHAKVASLFKKEKKVDFGNYGSKAWH